MASAALPSLSTDLRAGKAPSRLALWQSIRAPTTRTSRAWSTVGSTWDGPPSFAFCAPLDADPGDSAFASQWLAEIEPTLRPNTVLDYRWQLTHHLLPFFKDHRLSQVNVAEVDRYRAEKVREQRLSASSINKTLTRLGQILDVAEERELITRNPMSVNRHRRKLRASAPQRTYIDQAIHIETLLQAAGQLDREAREDRPLDRAELDRNGWRTPAGISATASPRRRRGRWARDARSPLRWRAWSSCGRAALPRG